MSVCSLYFVVKPKIDIIHKIVDSRYLEFSIAPYSDIIRSLHVLKHALFVVHLCNQNIPTPSKKFIFTYHVSINSSYAPSNLFKIDSDINNHALINCERYVT